MAKSNTPLDAGYQAMAVDKQREFEATEWCNALSGDMAYRLGEALELAQNYVLAYKCSMTYTNQVRSSGLAFNAWWHNTM